MMTLGIVWHALLVGTNVTLTMINWHRETTETATLLIVLVVSSLGSLCLLFIVARVLSRVIKYNNSAATETGLIPPPHTPSTGIQMSTLQASESLREQTRHVRFNLPPRPHTQNREDMDLILRLPFKTLSTCKIFSLMSSPFHLFNIKRCRI